MKSSIETILLPKTFDLIDSPRIDYELGDAVLEHCNSCFKEDKCKLNKNLRMAMGEDYPFWSDKFVVVDVQTPYKGNHLVCLSDSKVFCKDYLSPQLELNIAPSAFCDGIRKLIDISEEEKLEYLNNQNIEEE